MILERITGSPEVTNDGVTIAREIYLRDQFENMGAQLVKRSRDQDQRHRRRRHDDGDRAGRGRSCVRA